MKKCKKVKHPTYGSAMGQLRSLEARFGKGHEHVPLTVYRCKICRDTYHVGRNPADAVQNVLRLIDQAVKADKRAKRNAVD